MDLLTSDDLRAIIDILGDIRQARSREDIIQLALQRLAKLLGSDITAYNEVNPATGAATNYLKPDELDAEVVNRTLEQFGQEHPVLMHHLKTSDGSAHRISDFISQRQLHDTGLYRELFGKFGIEYQITLTLPARKGIIKALVFNRQFSDFTERDRAILNILQPHLTGAFESLRTVRRLQMKLEYCRGMLQNISEGIVILCGFGKVEMWTDKARFWFGKYFPGQARRPLTLPEEIISWLRKRAATDTSPAAPPAVFTKQLGTDRLQIRLVCSPELGRMLLLSESQPVTSAVPLESLGLSPRQVEVLLHVAYGRSNSEIARTLGISEHTVRRHLESILKITKAPNRTAIVSGIFCNNNLG